MSVRRAGVVPPSTSCAYMAPMLAAAAPAAIGEFT
jgi:hypothetical protein